MKHRWMCGLAAALLLGGMIPVQNVSAADVLRGDADESGEVGANDAQITLIAATEIVTGNENPMTESQQLAADVDGDAAVSVADAQFILVYYVSNNVSGAETDWEQVLHPMTEGEEARAALQHYFDAYQSGDLEEILECTNIRPAMHLFFADKVMSDEKLLEDLRADYEPYESYSIGETVNAEALIETLNAESEKIRKDAEEERQEQDDPDKIAVLDLAMTLFDPVDKLYSFDTAIGDHGNVHTETIYVLNRGGKWTVDMGVTDLVLYRLRTDRQKVADTIAKTVYNTFNSAVIELDERYEAPVTKLSGDFYFKGSDFERLQQVDVGKNSDPDTVLAALKFEAVELMSTLVNVESCAVYLENGVCRAAAVEKKYSGESWYGAYAVGGSFEGPYESLADALEAAKKQYQKTVENGSRQS